MAEFLEFTRAATDAGDLDTIDSELLARHAPGEHQESVEIDPETEAVLRKLLD